MAFGPSQVESGPVGMSRYIRVETKFPAAPTMTEVGNLLRFAVVQSGYLLIAQSPNSVFAYLYFQM